VAEQVDTPRKQGRARKIVGIVSETHGLGRKTGSEEEKEEAATPIRGLENEETNVMAEVQGRVIRRICTKKISCTGQPYSYKTQCLA
jgi:hypothetical protein